MTAGYTPVVFEITVHREFCAAHAISFRGRREPLHGHNWHVRATVSGSTLDGDGLLLDFHELSALMDEIVKRLDTTDLNVTPPFDEVNPTAENVALHIMRSLSGRLPERVMVSSVSVTEAPGCVATVRREQP
jgi:6-pyruvoyltetrahydropterin/6-carboxytetrahydropterin synthase